MARRLVKRSHEQISRVITTVVSLPTPAGTSAGAAASNSALKSLICCSSVNNRRPVNFQTNDKSRPEAFTQTRPGLILPPVRRRRQTVTDQQAAALGLELLAMTHQLFALPRHMPGLFLRFAGHPDHCQFPRVTLHVARESLTKRGRIARIGLYSACIAHRVCAAQSRNSAPRALLTLDRD